MPIHMEEQGEHSDSPGKPLVEALLQFYISVLTFIFKVYFSRVCVCMCVHISGYLRRPGSDSWRQLEIHTGSCELGAGH